jgi:hypothetical protein
VRAVIDKAKTRLTLGRIDEPVALSGGVGMHEGILDLDDVRVASAGGVIDLRGKLDPRGEKESKVVLHGETVPLQKVGDWLGVEHPLLFAELRCDLLATGRPDSLRLSGVLAGRRADGDREVTFVGTRVGRRLALESFRFRADSSLVDLTGQLDFDGGPSVEGVAVLRHVAPGTALADSDLAVIRDVDGVIRFAGTGLTRQTFRGGADVRIEDANVFGLDVGVGTFHLTLDSGALSLKDMRLSVGGAQLQGSGTISASDRVEARFSGEVPDLTALELPEGNLGNWVTQGRATAELSLSGPLAGPAVDATLHLSDLALAGVAASELHASRRRPSASRQVRWEFAPTARAWVAGYGVRALRRRRLRREEPGRGTPRSFLLHRRRSRVRRQPGRAESRKLLAKLERLELRARTTLAG